jgi:hypothetical protein
MKPEQTLLQDKPHDFGLASVRAGERQHLRARTTLPYSQAQSSQFQGSCQSNGGGLMVGGRGQEHFNSFGASLQVENQMIVTRERTS